MKKALSILMAALLLVALFAGCAKSDANTTQPSAADNTAAQDETTPAQDTASDPQPTDTEPKKELNVVLYANGNFGDNAYFDGNKAGILRAQDELGIKAKLIEGGSAQADYQSGIEALAASGEYDIIVTLTGKTSDIVYGMAEKYPDQNFFVLDTTMTNVRPNIFNAMYNQSEGAFLAGAFAALVTTSTELEGTNPDKVIGFVGVMDSPHDQRLL